MKKTFSFLFVILSFSLIAQKNPTISDYTTAIRLDPDAKVYNNRGNAYSDLGEYNTAISDYTTAIRLDPDYADAYSNRGNAYSDLGEYNTAIADYTTAIRLAPDLADAYGGRGIAKESAGLPYCSDYKKGCELGYNNSCEWYNDRCR